MIASLAASVLWAGLVAFGPATAEAQTLDEQNEFFLSPLPTGGCELFGGSPGVGEASPELAAICNVGGESGSSGGGNSGSSQTAGATVENRREARLEGKEEEADTTASFGPWGTFLSADYEALDRDVTKFEDGSASDVWRVTGGVDYRLRDDLLVGAFFTFADDQGDLDAGGEFETTSYSPTLFASYFSAPSEVSCSGRTCSSNVFADLSLGYTRHDYSRDRLASFVVTQGDNEFPFSGPVSSDVDGDQFGVQATLGYDFNVESFTIGPRIGLNYLDTEIDNYSERGTTGLELRFRDQSVTSLQTAVGMQASMAINTSFGVVLPTIDGSYDHEFDNDQRGIQVSYLGDLRSTPTRFAFQNEKPDRDFGNVGAGAIMILPNGFQPFVNFRALVGHSYFDSYVGTIGLRYELQ